MSGESTWGVPKAASRRRGLGRQGPSDDEEQQGHSCRDGHRNRHLVHDRDCADGVAGVAAPPRCCGGAGALRGQARPGDGRRRRMRSTCRRNPRRLRAPGCARSASVRGGWLGEYWIAYYAQIVDKALGKVVVVALGSLEGEVMRACWDAQVSLTVREALDRLNADRPRPLAYTTVMTVMSRLAEKGVLHREPRGRDTPTHRRSRTRPPWPCMTC
ncbi:BlaI/MecI/CopY family transcriptional regulator [Streptomyces sp. FXJ1.4098]|nr:BlaI/MecI/CopY family transcriptional regulator [Streptomyces sp. FXJ1.4098]